MIVISRGPAIPVTRVTSSREAKMAAPREFSIRTALREEKLPVRRTGSGCCCPGPFPLAAPPVGGTANVGGNSAMYGKPSGPTWMRRLRLVSSGEASWWR